MKAENLIPFQAIPLTPIHIGSGEIFTPLSWIIRRQSSSSYLLCLIDEAAFFAAHCADDHFLGALNEGNMETLRNLIHREKDIEQFILDKIPIPNASLAQKLEKAKGDMAKSGEIESFTRNPFTRRPYLPASSIKGAISTALFHFLNLLRGKNGKPLLCSGTDEDQAAAMREEMGEITNHAMRALRMGDIPLPSGSTSIRSATGIDLRPNRSLPKTDCEALSPHESGSPEIFGLMLLQSWSGKKPECAERGKPYIKLATGLTVNAEQLWIICRGFYQRRFKEEYDKFYTLPHFSRTAQAMEKIRDRVMNLGKDEALLRVGHYSHIECVTLTGVPARCKTNKAGEKLYGQTRTLADNKLPFGWLILKRCSMADYESARDGQRSALAKDSSSVIALSAKWEAKARQAASGALAKERHREEEARAKREAAETDRLKAETLASLPLPERLIQKLALPDMDDDSSNKIFEMLDKNENEELRAKRRDVALALKSYWKRVGKLSGKAAKKDKQKKKIARLEEIIAQG